MTTDAATSDVPDVTNLPSDGLADSGQEFADTSVSQADLDAVAPQADEAPSETERSLSLVDTTESEAEAETEETPEPPARPKTRFNPWT